MREFIYSGFAYPGTSIQDTEKICQDKFFCQDNGDFLYLSVADGASGAKYSQLGAKGTTEKTYSFIKENFDKFYSSNPFFVKKEIINFTRNELNKLADKKNVDIKEFATTFLFVAIKGEKIMAGHVGDGLIAYKKFDRIKVLSPPLNGEFLNQTYFVTSKYFLYHFRIYRGNIKGMKQLFLMTDGVTSSYYKKKEQELNKGFELDISKLKLTSKKELNISLRNLMLNKVCKRTHDDCCMVTACIN